jgi:F-box/leucine-rich repeat protein 2/20
LLEELDLSNPGEFAHHINFLDGLDALSLALFKLRKINLSGHCYVNDSSLLNLCKNCEFLEEVKMLNCSLLTHHGIAYAIRERRQTLRSLSIRWRSAGSNDVISSPFIDSLVSLMGLTSLDLSSSRISDKLLTSIATRGLPLRKLILLNCTGYSYVGIFSLLSKCQGIQHLDLQKAEFLNDHHVVELSLFLGGLMSINLSDSGNFTNLALFALVGNCSSLSEIRMEYTTIGKETIENSNSLMDFVVSPQLKFLHLAYSSCLKDESIKIFASIFPNLQLLDLSNCNDISEEGIYQILRRCCKIRHLNLTSCLRVKLHGMNFEIPQLKVLNLSYTGIDDKTLYVISKSCCGLLQLLLESCKNVTENGVEHVLENCTELREINLGYCNKVFVSIVDMVILRPSLRKITAPPYYRLSDENKELLSRHGCLVD